MSPGFDRKGAEQMPTDEQRAQAVADQFSAYEHAQLREKFALAIAAEFVRVYAVQRKPDEPSRRLAMIETLYELADAMAKRFGVDAK